MKTSILFFISFFLFISTSKVQADKSLPIKVVSQSKSIKNLCAPAAAEMITSFYDRNDLDQYVIAKGVCSMVAGYKKRYPKTNPIPCRWPDYKETYQPILANFLSKEGFRVKTTRSSYDKSSGNVSKKRQSELLDPINKGIPTIIHVERHYLLVVGYDKLSKELLINDPAGGKQLRVKFSFFINRYNPWYKGRKGWDGRYLSVWKN